jgi:transposase
MSKRAKPYSPEFRAEVLRLAAEGNKSDAEIERELGLSASLISRWRERYGEPGAEPESASSRENLSEAEQEIRRLQRELKAVKQERDILKKLLASSRRRTCREVPADRGTPPGV